MKKIFLLSLALGVLASCASATIEKRYAHINELYRNKLEKSVPTFVLKSSDDYDGDNQLLFYLDLGTAFFHAQDFSNAIQAFQKADQIAEDLYTESVTANVSTFMLNDNFAPYQGESYEQLYIHIYKALSYMMLDQGESAMVEIRKAHEKIQVLESQFADELAQLTAARKKRINKDKRPKASQYAEFPFHDSAMLRLLSALLYRADGELDDARIDKEKIQALWEMNGGLYGFKTPDISAIDQPISADSTYLDIVVTANKVGVKQEQRLDVVATGEALIFSTSDPDFEGMDAIPFTSDQFNFSFAIPKYVPAYRDISRVTLQVDNQPEQPMYTVEETDQFAYQQYQSDLPYTLTKTALRAAAKAFAAHQANQELEKKGIEGMLIGLAVSAVSAVSEQADIRSWRLLSNQWMFKEVKLSKGDHKVIIRGYNSKGQKVAEKIKVLNLPHNKLIYENLF